MLYQFSKSRKRRAMVALAVTASIAAVVGCSPSEADPSEESVPSLVVGTVDDITTFSPALSAAGSDALYTFPVYDRLIEFNPVTMELLPDAGLASEWGFLDEELTKFGLTLKPDVTFHDGTELNAEAVKFWLEYFTENNPGTTLELLDEISVVDELKLEMTLSTPSSAFPTVLSETAGQVMSPTAIEEWGELAGEHDAGTGPYRLVAWNRGDNAVYELYEDYYGELPNTGGLEIRVFKEPSSIVSALQTGEIHYSNFIDPVNLPALEAVEDLRVEREITSIPRFLHLNADKEPLNNPEVRRAISLAIDRQAVVDAVFGPDSGAVPNNQPFAPTSWAYSESNVVDSDPELARQILADEGQEGLELSLCTTGTATAQEADIYRDQLAAVGVEVAVDMQPSLTACADGLRSGKHDLFMIVLSNAAQPQSAVHNWVRGSLWIGDENANAAMHSLLDEALLTMDQDEQARIFTEIGALWNETTPQIIVYTRPNVVAYDVRLEGDIQSQVRPDLTGLGF